MCTMVEPRHFGVQPTQTEAVMQIQADTLDAKVRLLAANNRDSIRGLEVPLGDILGRKVSREYVRRIAAGQIIEEDVDVDVLLAMSIYWDVPLSDISKVAFDRSRKVLALHQKAKKMNPKRRDQRGRYSDAKLADAA